MSSLIYPEDDWFRCVFLYVSGIARWRPKIDQSCWIRCTGTRVDYFKRALETVEARKLKLSMRRYNDLRFTRSRCNEKKVEKMSRSVWIYYKFNATVSWFEVGSEREAIHEELLRTDVLNESRYTRLGIFIVCTHLRVRLSLIHISEPTRPY